jgi:hypothetical protein
VTASPFWSGRVKSGAFRLTSMTKYLYRKWGLAVTLAAALGAGGTAQVFRAPQAERATPRAVAVLETFSNGVQRLVPVSFFYEHHFYDATFYRATPVPLALDAGTVYEVQQAGKALGTFTLQRAAPFHREWFAVGRFRKAPDKAALARKKAAVVVRDPSLPVLHRREGSEGDRPPPASAQAQSAPTSGENDPNRPHLHYGGEDSAARKERQQEIASAEIPEAAAGRVSAAATGDEDSGRPVLRRGKPSDEESEADSGASAARSGEPASEQKDESLTVMRQVAVSDAGPSREQEVSFACSAEERRKLEDAARRLAEAELLRLAPMRGLALDAGAAIAWQEEQFALYALDYSNYATVVFSARYRPADAPQQSPGWVVTVIARQQDTETVRLYGAVSDPRALGLYPELRLVDAVDPDGYGRYALLFRERKRDGVSWLLARVSGLGLQTLLETPER